MKFRIFTAMHATLILAMGTAWSSVMPADVTIDRLIGGTCSAVPCTSTAGPAGHSCVDTTTPGNCPPSTTYTECQADAENNTGNCKVTQKNGKDTNCRDSGSDCIDHKICTCS
ncbi:hypothetical protein [Singulisphaera acidiphila]|uniref:Secreted protein n=1 Tax=Singulisphaera acidiphila (strain ATCC BAA-1392 / DSM 18658 / VKM B-2454 / MOB10) TaxID=886293 RepID=L0DQQ2_SINAD|nr:hypothetical protein [Singulisphaera acidiphila]AGA31308.1 hypothetical protein Sinac_7266 [Singulisphaera acidiphila DSM 18658]